MAKKTTLKKKPTAPTDDARSGLDALAKAVASVAEELRPLYHLDTINDNHSELAGATDTIGYAIAALVIAHYGSADDRTRIIGHLKGWFHASEVFKED
jgi:hypothetical protein